MIPFADALADRATLIADDVARTLATPRTARALAIRALGLLIIDGCLMGVSAPTTLDALLDRAPSSSWARAARATLYSLPRTTAEEAFSGVRSLAARLVAEFTIAI